MTQTTYQVTFKTDDGKLAVTVATDDSESMKRALAVAKRTFDEIVAQPDSQPEQEAKEDAPICAVHNVLMVKETGKHGMVVWSCHQRNADGSRCSRKYRPSEP